MKAGSPPYILSLDLGTTNLKASIISSSGRLLLGARRELPMAHPRPGWAEQDPEAYWDSVVEILQEIAPTYRVDALAISTQRGGVIFIDRVGQPISRIITWLDRRSQCEATRAAGAIAGWPEAARMLVRRGPSALSKIMWFREHERSTFDNAARVLISVKDFVLYRMTGQWLTDIPQASLSGLYNVQTSSWCPRLATLAGVEVTQLPELALPTAIAGTLRREIAISVGLPSGLPVIVGSGDAEAAHVGLGAFEQGMASMNLGTIGAVRTTSSSLPTSGAEMLACVDMRPHGWIVGAMVRTAGVLLKWLRDSWTGVSSSWDFLNEAAAIHPGAEGLLLLPHFGGSIHPDIPNARGVFFGLTLRHGRAHIVRASLEGIAFALADALAYLEEVTQPCTRIRVSGGGAQSPLWLQIIADVCERPLEIPLVLDASLLGAAIMAAVGIDTYPDLHRAMSEMVHVEREVHPLAANTGTYRRLRSTARRLLEQLQPYFDETMMSFAEGRR